jgi:tetratricopeptide (TPR) repeat protein
LKKAVSYGEMAAKRATSVYAYGETVRLLEQTLKVQEVLDPEDKGKRCDLLLNLCDALYLAVDLRRILDVEVPAAFSLAESIGDGSRAARACIAALLPLVYKTSWATPQYAEWAARADRYARPNTAERAFTDIALGAAKCWKGEVRSGIKLLTQAFDLARRLGDQEVLWYTAAVFLWHAWAPQHIEQRMRLSEELWAGSHSGLNVNTVYALYWIVDTSLMMGHRQLAEEVWGELLTLAERTGNIQPGLLSASVDAALAVMDGRLEDTMDMAKSIQARGEEAGVSAMAYAFASPGVIAQLYLGASLEALEREIPREAPERLVVPCLVQALLGRKEEASEILEKNVVKRPGIGTLEDETPTGMDTLYLEASVRIGHHEAAGLLLKRLSSTGVCTTGLFYPTCIPRHLGGAAALLGRYDEARKYY